MKALYIALLLAQFTFPLHHPSSSAPVVGPVFASTVHNMCTAFSGPTTCAVTAGGGETVFVMASDLTSGNTVSSITDSAGGTPTLCSGYPVTTGVLNLYLWKFSSATSGAHTYTVTWNLGVSFASTGILAATNVTSSNCASLANTGSISSTGNVAGVSFTNTANALALCFITMDSNYPVTSAGSTFTMSNVDIGNGSFAEPGSGQGSVPSAGTNNCSWQVTPGSTTNWAQAEVVLQ